MAGWLGALALVGFAAGPAAIQLGVLSGFVGFRIFGLGILLGALGLLVGLVGLWHTRVAAGRPGRGRAVFGVVVGLVMAGFAVVGSGGAPAINDITTDPEDPPAFVHAGGLAANRDRDMSYPGDAFARQQRAAYPDLASIELDLPPERAFAAAEQAAREIGLEITYRDAERGLLEATETTRIFRFVDDVAIRVRADGGGSRIDVRSKSRDGRGDLGANAERIRRFREALTS